ncbi:ABC transporter ATP-binding protein [Motilimonas pumila]|uniref:ATP-binding cassette domain-containing protein n=1 Tax=Motilimonas pumila TaxID=2303987 RepID=A0A418Y9P0_9GAMM|nr:ATP-binding cassette domain-containing protein [Motilimonas pumila]RJG37976.1 ATP-binding cassette domain-containing protein [Motilimonas pumila]
MLQAKQLGFKVGQNTLLKDVSLSFSQGKVYGLVGHNGSGKSTLLKLLANQQSSSNGEILLHDKPIAKWSSKAFAKQIAYLPQHLPATDSLVGRDLVSFGRYPWHGLLGRLTRQDNEFIDQAMTLTHTEQYANRLVDTLSGGERQRVWLAMLLAQKTHYLLLDEPLSALDIRHQIEVLALIKRLSKELNLGVIIVLHDINMAARFCDHIVAMHSGRMLCEGNVKSIITPDWLKQIYNLDMDVIRHQGGYPVAIPGLAGETV